MAAAIWGEEQDSAVLTETRSGPVLTSSSSVSRTLLAGGMGSMMLDWYGWESIFYAIGFLSGVWALVVWQFFLTG